MAIDFDGLRVKVQHGVQLISAAQQHVTYLCTRNDVLECLVMAADLKGKVASALLHACGTMADSGWQTYTVDAYEPKQFDAWQAEIAHTRKKTIFLLTNIDRADVDDIVHWINGFYGVEYAAARIRIIWVCSAEARDDICETLGVL